MKALYLLVVDKAWAKLYKTAHAAQPLALVYHQALFGSAQTDTAEADEDLARSLCRLLRGDRLSGRYGQLVLLASPRMLAALHRQYDGDWANVVTGQIADLPARYTDEDLGGWLQRRLVHAEQQPDSEDGMVEQLNLAAVTTQRQG
ncbi:MAG: host attachment protein [Gammaproteobacteria bacterium]